MGTRCDARDLLERFKAVCTNSPDVRESKAVPSRGLRISGTGYFVTGNGFRIPQEKIS